MAKDRRVDIFSVMRKLDAGNKDVYGQYMRDKDAVKELNSFIGFLALRWMSAADGPNDDAEFCLESVNELVNSGYFKLSGHHELQAKLLAVAGARKKIRHAWIPQPKKRIGTLSSQAVLGLYPHLKDDEVALWIELFGPDAVLEAARRIGWQSEEMQKLQKELNPANR